METVILVWSSVKSINEHPHSFFTFIPGSFVCEPNLAGTLVLFRFACLIAQVNATLVWFRQQDIHFSGQVFTRIKTGLACQVTGCEGKLIVSQITGPQV